MSVLRMRIVIASALGTMLVGGCRVIQRVVDSAQPAAAAPVSSLEGVAEAMRDTLAERLAQIELDRVALLTRRSEQSPEVAHLDRQRLVLCRELTELQRTISVEAITTARVLRAVEERMAGLAVERALSPAGRNAGSPEIRALDSMLVALQRRRSSLRAPRNGGELRACPATGTSP